jgi:hypothetical protein
MLLAVGAGGAYATFSLVSKGCSNASRSSW